MVYNDYDELSDHICSGHSKQVLDILRKNQNLDVTHKGGKFFTISVEGGNTEIVQALLDYFEENQLKSCANSQEQGILKMEMTGILRIAIEDVKISEEMKKTLSSYINFDDTSSQLAMEEVLTWQEEDDVVRNYDYLRGESNTEMHDNGSWSLPTVDNLSNLQNSCQQQALGADGNADLGHLYIVNG
jgi:hypothetical protein